MDAIPYTNEEWLEAHDKLVTKVARQGAILECARICMDRNINETARAILALLEESK